MACGRWCMHMCYLIGWFSSGEAQECSSEAVHAVREPILLQRYATSAKLVTGDVDAVRADGNSSTFPNLAHYASWSERLDVELAACRQAQERANRTDARMKKNTKHLPQADDAPKIAFLFLVMDGIGNEAVWDSFFVNAPKRYYSIYVHRAEPQETTTEPLKKWGAVSVPRVSSGWCALSGVEVALFSEALGNQANVQFVLVSESTVPLKSFYYMYKELVHKSSNTSKICYSADVSPIMLKHHQWVILSRTHALSFVQASESAIRRSYAALGDGRECCSDEIVVTKALFPDVEATPINDLEHFVSQNGVEKLCLTWVSWGDDLKGTHLELPESHGLPHQFGPQGDDPTVKLSYLKMLVTEEGFLFGRKFNNGCLVDNGTDHLALAAELPQLWEQVDADKTSARVWSLLKAGGALVSAEHQETASTAGNEETVQSSLLALSTNASSMPELRNSIAKNTDDAKTDVKRRRSSVSTKTQFWYGTLFTVGLCSALVLVDAMIYPSE